MNIYDVVLVIWLIGTCLLIIGAADGIGGKRRLTMTVCKHRLDIPWPLIRGKLSRGCVIAVGLLILIFAFFQTHQLSKMPEVKSVVFELEDGTKIIATLQIRRIALFPTTFEPPEIGILSRDWDRLTEEERRKALIDAVPKLPDDTLVSLRAEGMETFEVKFWKDLLNQNE